MSKAKKSKSKNVKELTAPEQLAPEQRKELYKNKKGMKGQPYNQDELKERITLMLTPTARAKLTALAQKMNLSKSEWLERLLRSLSL